MLYNRITQFRLDSTLSLSGQIDLEDKTRIPERFRRADYSSGLANRKAMLSNVERAALARQLLLKVLQKLSGLVPPELFQPYQLENGDLMAVLLSDER